MADKTKLHVVRGDNTFVESMTKEEIYNAIVQAVEQGEIGDIDKGFITSIKEQNRNSNLKFWFGTTAEYNALQTIDPQTYYIRTDSDLNDLLAAIAEANRQIEILKDRVTALETTIQSHTTELSTHAEKIEALAKATFYKKDEVIHVSDLYVNGTVTAGGDEIRFMIPKNKMFYTGDEIVDWYNTYGTAVLNYISFTLIARQNGTEKIRQYFVVPDFTFVINEEGIFITINNIRSITTDLQNNAGIALNLSGLHMEFNW